jgi:plastocyanin
MRRLATALGVLSIGLGLVSGCSEDDDTLPPADEEVKIQTERFFPSEVTILPGRRVRWVNTLPKSADNVRTVTSGAPGSPDGLFDATLQGYDPGEPVGDSFVFIFQEGGEYPYFSTRPGEAPFTGKVIVE